MNNTKDLEARLYMYFLRLKEDANKEYSKNECEYNIVYVFNNYDEYYNYFNNNGYPEVDVNLDILRMCKLKKTKKGSIIAMKALCDYAITRHNELTKPKTKKLAKTI